MIMNFGMHSNNHSEYQEWLAEFADYYRSHGSHMPYLIWRDSSPQHFSTPTGDFTCDGCDPLETPFKCQVGT